ncbi:response regulator [Bdellovibrio sp. HCB2-146]|uniref:response regulator n=1 Tax=Bdellovibrio sp. HCB2-146 TaxID=3394362 RepID=UPI0039BD6C22
MTVDLVPLSILVVDDESSVKYLSEMNFRKAISAHQVELHFFSTAQECLEYLLRYSENARETVVLTDINMPVMSGYELLEKIKHDYPEVNVYMMSAYDDDASMEKSYEAGARGYFIKPVNYRFLKQQLSDRFGVSFS